MKRFAAWVVLSWCVVCAAWAGEVEHKRGDFRFFVGDPAAFVQPHQVAATWDPKAPGADDAVWRYWLTDEQVDHRKGVDATYIDYVYEARAAAHVGEAGRYQVDFNPEYQRLVLHNVQVRRDGKWQDRLQPDKISLARRETRFEKDLADGLVTALIVLDDVRVGDVVRVNYSVIGSNPILAGQSIDGISQAWRSPVLDAHLRVLFDPGTQVRSHVRNGAKPAAVRNIADGVEARVDVHGARAVVDEGNYPEWYTPNPRLLLGPARSWAEVVKWALPLYPQVDALPADLQARIAEWKKLPDPQARLRAALHTVQDEVRYFGVEMGSNTHRPTPPADTWTRRYGDCKDKAYLLSTILRALDIHAVPALISTTRSTALRDLEPTAAAFDHVIVRATMGNDIVWVDPTMTQQGGDPRTLDLSDYGLGLPIEAGTADLQPVAPPKQTNDAISTIERYSAVGQAGQLQLDIETTYSGQAANYARINLGASRSDDLERRNAQYYRQRFGDLDVKKTPGIQDDREANKLKVTESYLLKSPFQQEGTQVRGLDIFAETLDGPTKLPEQMKRSGPLEVGRVADYRHEIVLDGPPGWHATAPADTAKFASSAFDYSRTIERNGDQVHVVYALKVKAREIDAAGSAEHLAQMRDVRENLSARLRFQAPATPMETSERDKRLKALLRGALDGGTQ